MISVQELPEKIRGDATQQAERKSGGYIAELPAGGITLRELERELIEKTLKKCSGNKSLTADLLGISRKALYEKIERYEIAPWT
jgi:DNA-binding NtrC family response regulator